MTRALAAILGAAGGTMLALNRRLNVWEDEAYTLETTTRGIVGAAKQAMHYEQYPPVYFAALAAWRMVHRSPVFARAFSTAAALLAVRDGSHLICEFVPEAERPAVALALAAHPYVVWAGTEARAYALVMWISTRIVRAWRDAFLAGEPAAGADARLIAWTLAGIATQYYLGFVFAACGLATLVVRPRSALRFARDGAVVALGLIPLARALRHQLSNYTQNYDVPIEPFEMARRMTGTLAAFVLPSQGLRGAWRPLVGFGALALAAIVASDPRSRARALVPGIVAASAPAFCAATLQAAKINPVLPIHATPFFFPSLIAVAATLRTRRRLRTATVISVAIAAAGMRELFGRTAKIGDWRRVADVVTALENDEEPLLIFQPEAMLPLEHHYRGRNRMTGVPVDVAFDRYDLSRFVLHDPSQVAAAIERAGVRSRCWLVTTATSRSLGFDFNAPILENYVAAHFRVDTDIRLYGSRVRRLTARMDPAADFTAP